MKPLAVYIHVPFCAVKCGYCDFNAYAGLDRLHDAYVAALLREVEDRATILQERRVTSISFGGGTPADLPPGDLARVVRAVLGAAGEVDPAAEISIEANPGTTPPEAFEVLAAAGVNRVSLGAQSFDSAELRFLDRTHGPGDVAEAVRAARAAGIASLNLDLIFGLPGQSLAAWGANLDWALELAPDHLSCYALTVEEGTPLATRAARGEVEPLDEDAVAAQYDLACNRLAAAGLRHYEISNWAHPGHESRHNIVYWTAADYLGLGAGAHSYLDGFRFETIAHPRQYVTAWAPATAGTPPLPQRGERGPGGEGLPGILNRYRPVGLQAMADWLEGRLRLLNGFPAAEFIATFGEAPWEAAGGALSWARGAGLVEEAEGQIRLTRRGLLLHSEVIVRVLAADGADGILGGL